MVQLPAEASRNLTQEAESAKDVLAQFPQPWPRYARGGKKPACGLKGSGVLHQRKKRLPATYPTAVTINVARGYQVATNKGLSSKQFEA